MAGQFRRQPILRSLFGVLALLAPRVPVSLKVFLTALAIIDDFGSVVIIAGVLHNGLSPLMLGWRVSLFVVLLP